MDVYFTIQFSRKKPCAFKVWRLAKCCVLLVIKSWLLQHSSDATRCTIEPLNNFKYWAFIEPLFFKNWLTVSHAVILPDRHNIPTSSYDLTGRITFHNKKTSRTSLQCTPNDLWVHYARVKTPSHFLLNLSLSNFLGTYSLWTSPALCRTWLSTSAQRT